MAVFCNKTSIDKLTKRPSSTKKSGFGYGLGGNDVTSRPQTINQQPRALTTKSPLPKSSNPKFVSTSPTPPEQAGDAELSFQMSKNDINLSRQELIKLLEEA